MKDLTIIKVVRFAEKESENIPSTTCMDCSNSKESASWYDKKEIKNFCKDVENMQMKLLASNDKIDKNEIEEYFPSPYFLSHEQMKRRKRQRHYSSKIIIETQDRLGSSELATVSCGLTRWARIDALKYAKKAYRCARNK